MEQFVGVLNKHAPKGLRVVYELMPGALHSMIFHPAALKAFRAVSKPDGEVVK